LENRREYSRLAIRSEIRVVVFDNANDEITKHIVERYVKSDIHIVVDDL